MWSVGLGGYDHSAERDDHHRVQGYLEEEGLRGSLVYMPNPHVIIVEHTPVSQETRETIARKLNECVSGGANVGFFTFQDRNSGFLAVWERGVGWTPACGSGAAAVLRTCIAFGLADTRLEVNQLGGSLRVERRSDGLIWITGSAGLVYTGTIFLNYEENPPEDTWRRDTRRDSSLCV
jgi:diaminopimelate epimerase